MTPEQLRAIRKHTGNLSQLIGEGELDKLSEQAQMAARLELRHLLRVSGLSGELADEARREFAQSLDRGTDEKAAKRVDDAAKEPEKNAKK